MNTLVLVGSLVAEGPSTNEWDAWGPDVAGQDVRLGLIGKCPAVFRTSDK